MEETKELITTDDIRSKVYIIRGQQVMLDKDLAEIYGYEVKKLNQQVKRNIERFPEDFMFRLSNSEIDSVRSQIVTSRNPESTIEMWKLREQAKMQANTDDNADSDDDFYDDVIAQSALNWMEKD